MLLIFVIISCFLQFSTGTLTEDCIRCLCHARTGCYQLKNCASYSINQDYWNTAGRPTLGDDSPVDPNAFMRCIQDDGCIIRTITGYINALREPDCNCDDVVTCKDYFATHLYGSTCNRNIERIRLTRFDTCARQKNVANTAGWTIPGGCTPEPSVDRLPEPV